MGVLLGVLAPLRLFNDAVLAAGRVMAACALAIMVGFILTQVFFRYVLNAALPWPDEAARFAMLWMTGLIAPTAYRRGGFVAIDMFARALPAPAGRLLSFALLALSTAVIWYALGIAWSEVTGFAGTFKTASLYTVFFPSFGDLSIEFGLAKMPRSHMMASLLVGMGLMLIVSAELLLRLLIEALGGADRLPPLQAPDMAGAE